MVGAAVLSAMGAVRSGAGLVRVGVVKSQQNAFMKRAPLEVTTLALAEDRTGQLSIKAWNQIRGALLQFRPNVVAMGPGLGTGAGVQKILTHILKIFRGGLVVDADAINALAILKFKKKFPLPVVLTPHVGELGRLLAWSTENISKNRKEAARTTSKRYDCVCLLKGAGTLVSDGRRTARNPTGNPAMASGGMGDILTGMIASLWAQRPVQTIASGWEAACAGAFLHGRAADEAVKDFPEKTLLASDVVSALQKIFKTVFKRGGL